MPLLGEPGHGAAGVEAAAEGDAERGALRAEATCRCGSWPRDVPSSLPVRNRGYVYSEQVDAGGAGRTRPRAPPHPLGARQGGRVARPHRRRGGAGGGRRGGGGAAAPRRPAPHLGAASLGRARCAGLHRGAVRGCRPPRRRQAAWAAHHAGGGLYLESTLLAVVRGLRPGAFAGAPPGTGHLRRGALRADPGGPGRAAARAPGAARPQGLPGPLRGPPGGRRLRRRRPHRRGPYPPTGTLHAATRTARPSRSLVRVLERRDGRGGDIAPRGGDRDRAPAPDPHPPGLRRPPAASATRSTAPGGCPSRAARPCRATPAIGCTPSGSSSPTPGRRAGRGRVRAAAGDAASSTRG